jgi:hypothetical protein
MIYLCQHGQVQQNLPSAAGSHSGGDACGGHPLPGEDRVPAARPACGIRCDLWCPVSRLAIILLSDTRSSAPIWSPRVWQPAHMSASMHTAACPAGCCQVLASLLDFQPQDFGLPPFTDQVAGTVRLDPVWRLRGTVVRGFGRGSKAIPEPSMAWSSHCMLDMKCTSARWCLQSKFLGCNDLTPWLLTRNWGSQQPTWTALRCMGSWQKPSQASTQARRPGLSC